MLLQHSMREFDPLGSNLIFLISLPRSGSTLLQRILGGHPGIATLAEPWLMLHPLYALKRGGIETEYDANLARDALDDFLQQIDAGEEAYIEGVRALTGGLYACALTRLGKNLFLDKTPRYYRIIPELRRVYPRAKFVFLLRNPLAALASTLQTWFDNDPEQLRGTTNHQDLLEGPGYVIDGIAALGDDAIVVRYEDLVSEPERVVMDLCRRLAIEFSPPMLEYGQHAPPPGRFGDQIGVTQHTQATPLYRDKWIQSLAQEPQRSFALDYLDAIGDEPLHAFGYDPQRLRQRLLEEAPTVTDATDDATSSQAERLNAEGETLFAQGRRDAARACFEQALAIDPEYATTYNNLLVLHWENGAPEKALEQLANGLECAPLDRQLIVTGGQILAALGLTDEAAGLFARYLEHAPDDVEITTYLTEVTSGNRSGVDDETRSHAPDVTVPAAAQPASAGLTPQSRESRVITVATSIAPKGIDKQQRAIQSWRVLGFRIASLNTAAEIAELAPQFPGVEFIQVSRDGRSLAGKPYVFLDDVLDYLRQDSGSDIVGIVNSDIILRADSALTEYLVREAEGALVYGSRVDIKAADDTTGALYHRGLDFFFMDREVIERLPRTQFMLGVPWWDYWVPIGFQLNGVRIKRLDSRIAFHVWHPTNYSSEVLFKFAKEFVEHCAAATFVHLYEQCVANEFGNAGYSVLSDAALDYIGRHTDHCLFPGAPAAIDGGAVDTGRTPRVSAIVSTYKSAAFISECLDDLVNQTIAERIEIIVIDANSPEGEGAIVADYQRRYPHIPIRYQRTDTRIGVYAAWNMAARLAQGEYLISCSTNDRLRQDACEILARTLDENPDVALVYGNSFMTKLPHETFATATLCSLYIWPDYSYETLLERCMVGPHPMWRRALHDRHGFFDESYVALGDQEFWLRLGEHERLMNIPCFTGLYYVSESSLTGNGDIAQRETERVHLHYRWRQYYRQWQQQAAKRRAAPDEAGRVSPSIHVLVLIPPGGLSTVADTLDDLGVQDYADLHVTLVADQPPPDPTLLADGGLRWCQYRSLDELMGVVQEAVAAVPAEWLCLIDAGDRLDSAVLDDCMQYAARNPQWRMIYGDDDCLSDMGPSHSPRFKPDFNLSMLRATPYVGAFLLVRRDAFETVSGIATVTASRGSELALKIADRYGDAQVGHIPRVMLHRNPTNDSAWSVEAEMAVYRRAVIAHLQRRGVAAEVQDGLLESTFFIRHQRVDTPLVTVVVGPSTCADERRLVLQTLLTKTRYENYEIILLEQNAHPETMPVQGVVKAERVRSVIVEGMRPGEACNHAAQSARGEYLLWLDGRSLVLQEDWIDRLIAQAAEEDVGIVGARLVDKRKSTLDAGVILGLGTRGIGARANVGTHMQSPGYMGRLQLVQDLSAVTSLCMLMRKAVFDAVGGFDAALSTGLYRDVDVCSKTREAGWRIVWTPAVTLMYLGSNTQADRPPSSKEVLDDENERVLDKWLARLSGDPAYNRNLSHIRQDFQVETHTVPDWDPVVDSLPRILGYGVGSYGSWKYRVTQPLEALDETRMAQCTLTPFSDKKPVTLPTLIDIEIMQPQTLLLHNTLHDNYLEAIARYKRHNDAFMVFGQDDLMFALPPKNPYSRTVYKDIKKRVRRCAEMADRILVTTEPLAEALRDFSDAVQVLPNYLSQMLWGNLHSLRRQGDKPRVGWAGAQQHGGDLELLTEVVKATADEVDWVFFGMCPEAIRPYVREFHRAVGFSEYPTKLASLNLDLAVAPLERNRFNEAKSNLRILEYGVLGWPVVASDIHPYQTGPVCRVPNNPAAWVRAIRERVSDLEAAAREGDQLRVWVRTGWMLEDHLHEWLAALSPQGSAQAAASPRMMSLRS